MCVVALAEEELGGERCNSRGVNHLRPQLPAFLVFAAALPAMAAGALGGGGFRAEASVRVVCARET